MKQTLLLLTVMPLVIALASATQKPVPHDGSWWLSISADEQQQYQWGYGDCYVDSLKSKRPPPVDDRKLAQLISARYRNGKAKSTELVPTVMKDVWAANEGIKAPVEPKGGEIWTEPHGFFDGLWWKGGTDAEKLGFVEGEIDCFNEEGSSQFRFPLAASDYVKWLDEAYGLDQNSSISHFPDTAKVPEVLLKKARHIAKK